jgi:predicted acetyltransferase
MVNLVDPAIQYISSYNQALEEFKHENRSLEYRCPKPGENFEDFQTRINNMQKGEGLPEGYVPETVMWLVDANEFIGEASIRHELTDFLLKAGGHIGYVIRPTKRRLGYGTKLLELALKEAGKIGISKVLLTCDETNIGSAKIIEANGGILENAVDMDKGKPRKLRYWIKIT